MDVSLAAHIDRFNEGARSGDFASMLAAFAPDAELVFVGVPVGPFFGVDAIAAAYAAQPPDDTIILLGRSRHEDGMEVADYAWAADGVRAGKILLGTADGTIVRLVVTFEG